MNKTNQARIVLFKGTNAIFAPFMLLMPLLDCADAGTALLPQLVCSAAGVPSPRYCCAFLALLVRCCRAAYMPLPFYW